MSTLTEFRPEDLTARQSPVPLATLIGRELRGVKCEKPVVKYGHAAFAKRGEDYFLVKPDSLRITGDSTSAFSVFAVFDGHNGGSAAVFTKEHLLDHVMSAVPPGIGREEWLELLPQALVAGFVKTDIEFQRKGTTATLVAIDGSTVTVASVGDSRCILDSQGGVVTLLTVDHRLEENVEERERVTASGGEVGRLNLCGGKEIGPLRCWPGGLCLSRSIGDTDVGEFIVPIPHVKQVKLSSAGGRLIIASDGIWDAVSSEVAAKVCRGLPAELSAKLVVKEALRKSGLKDDTTCLVVDIIPPEQFLPPHSGWQKKKWRSILFRRKSRNCFGKPSKLSSIGAVEEIFEEGSAMLEERTKKESFRLFGFTMKFMKLGSKPDSFQSDGKNIRLGKNLPSKTNLDSFRCAICQMDQTPNDGSIDDAVICFSSTSKSWEGPYLCIQCRRKKDAMEGKWHRELRMSR